LQDQITGEIADKKKPGTAGLFNDLRVSSIVIFKPVIIAAGRDANVVYPVTTPTIGCHPYFMVQTNLHWKTHWRTNLRAGTKLVAAFAGRRVTCPTTTAATATTIGYRIAVIGIKMLVDDIQKLVVMIIGRDAVWIT